MVYAIFATVLYDVILNVADMMSAKRKSLFWELRESHYTERYLQYFSFTGEGDMKNLFLISHKCLN